MIEPNERHPTGQHEGAFKADVPTLRQLLKAGVPVISVGLGRYRIAGAVPPEFDLRRNGEND